MFTLIINTDNTGSETMDPHIFRLGQSTDCWCKIEVNHDPFVSVLHLSNRPNM